MKTPEEIKQIVTRLAGVATVLDQMAERCYGSTTSFDDRQAYLRAALYVRDGADLIDELLMANAVPIPEFPEGSLAAHRPKFRAGCCELERTTIHGLMRCWNVAKVERTFPREECEGMFGAPVNFKVCEECAKKEIRFTPNQIPYGVE